MPLARDDSGTPAFSGVASSYKANHGLLVQSAKFAMFGNCCFFQSIKPLCTTTHATRVQLCLVPNGLCRCSTDWCVGAGASIVSGGTFLSVGAPAERILDANAASAAAT